MSFRGIWSSLEARVWTYPFAVLVALVWFIPTTLRTAHIIMKNPYEIVIVHGNTMSAISGVMATQIARIGLKFVSVIYFVEMMTSRLLYGNYGRFQPYMDEFVREAR